MDKVKIFISLILILGGLQIFFIKNLEVYQIIVSIVELCIGCFTLFYEIKNNN